MLPRLSLNVKFLRNGLPVLSYPAKTDPDRSDPELRHALAVIPEFGNRVLRVIYNHTTNPWLVVSVYFDRTQRGRI